MTPESITIGQMIPNTNNANANTPTATTLCSPDAAPAAMPYAPSVNSTIDVSVSSPGPLMPTPDQGRGDSTAPTISPTVSQPP